MLDQIAVGGVLLGALALFAWGYWRYDVVALLALLILVLVGVVPAADAFAGFAHPAIVTVAAMLILSKALEKSGIVDFITRRMSGLLERPAAAIVSLTALATFFSGFMNNIGALALMLPVALQMTRKSALSPNVVLMPIAFGSILGGLTTLIGTPPNIIIASYRAQHAGEPFGIFDFTPVGLAVAVAGVALIALLSRCVLPNRESAGAADVYGQLEPYVTELLIPPGSSLAGASLECVEARADGDASVIELIRNGESLLAPRGRRRLRENDVLVIEADPASLNLLLAGGELELAHDKQFDEAHLTSDEVAFTEAVIMPRSDLDRRSSVEMRLRSEFGINLLALSRRGARLVKRLGHERLRVGDVLLLQGDAESMPETLSQLGCLPLEGRSLDLGQSYSILPLILFLGALGLSSVGILEVQVALMLAAVLVVLTGELSLRDSYESIDWPVIVLLGAMVPVGQSLEIVGLTQEIAGGMSAFLSGAQPAVVVTCLLVTALLLSNVVNNAATAILMAPLALTIASDIGVNPDALLMAVAVGSSCAFLTPIGHQSNLLVMGPGGYRFSDYFRLGLPLSVGVCLVAVPMILIVWPL